MWGSIFCIWHFTKDFRASFPVSSVNRLGEISELQEVGRFPNAGDFIFNASRESMVELMLEGSFAPFDLGGDPGKVDHVPRYVLVLFEVETLEFSLTLQTGINFTTQKIH